MSTFKYSVNTNGLKKKYSIPEIIDMCVKLNLDGIEWGLSSLADAENEIKEMSKQTADAGLEVVGYINGGKLWKKDVLKQWADIVHSVSGKSLRVAHPWVAYNYSEALHQGKTFIEIFNMARDAMPFLEELSKESGVRFLVETHGGALVASPLAAVKLFEGISPEAVGVIYDPANTILEGGIRPRSEVEVLGDYLAYVHAKNTMYMFDGSFIREPVPRAKWTHKSISPAYGILDWVEQFYALKVGGFSGWISSEEYFSAGDDQFEQIREGIAFLKECEKAAPVEAQTPFTTFND